jgi:hypothetical protein
MNKTDTQAGAPQCDAVEASSDLQRGVASTSAGHPVHHDHAAATLQTSGLTMRAFENTKSTGIDQGLVQSSLIQPSCHILGLERNTLPRNVSAPVSSLPPEALAKLTPFDSHKRERSSAVMRAHTQGDRKELITAAPAGHVPMLNMTTEELSADLKKIYGNLANIEAKCITIDTAQAAEPRAALTNEQWQTLIALHRTLLYDHHDFIMVSGMPSLIMMTC